jgi:putative ABC transport system permease protein
MLTRLRSLVVNLIARTRVERDLDEELRFHLDARADDLVRRGLPRVEAERQARLEFGAVDGYKDDCREARGLRLWDEALADLRFAGRSLRHAPGVSAAAILSLALGIGANVAIFSLVNAVVLKPLPVRDPGRLVLLQWNAKGFPERYMDSIEGNARSDPASGLLVSPALPSNVFDAMRPHAFSHVLAFAGSTPANVAVGGRAGSGELLGVSGNYFEALGVVPPVGRALHPTDDAADRPDVAVASWTYWQRSLGSTAPGTVLVVNGAPVTLVGVAPPEFGGLQPGQSPDLYVPLKAYAGHYRRAFDYDLRDPRVWWLNVVGRLRPGVSQAQAAAEVSSLFRGTLGLDDLAQRQEAKPQITVVTARGGLDDLRSEYSTVLTLLMAMVGVVLLVACANVASLLFARAAARQRDIAVRLSLGASRGRIVRQLLTESLVLGLLGGLLGLLAGAWVSDAATATLANGGPAPLPVRAPVDGSVLVFTLFVSIASTIVFGVVPALGAARRGLGQSLTRRGDAGLVGLASLRSGKLLVGAQVALCLVLLAGAGLLRGSLTRLQQVNLGFDPKGLLVLRVQPGLNAYGSERLAAYYDNLTRAVAAVPGVRSVALSQHGLIGEGWSQGMAEITGTRQPIKKARFWRQVVSASFFHTIGIPLLEGRLLADTDGASAPHVVVVNRRFVREHLHGENPIGLTLRDGRWTATIVGVVGDTKYGSVRDEAPPAAFIPYVQHDRSVPASMVLEARMAGDVETGLAAVGRAALAVDVAVPPTRIDSQEARIEKALFTERALALLSTAFGSLALMLASVGLFGTLSYAVARRTGEIGVRMAFGARRSAVVGMVLRDTLVITGLGVVAGLPLAWMSGRLVSRQLFGLSPHDPTTLVGVAAVIFAVALVAGAIPALRASRVDPMTALRDE